MTDLAGGAAATLACPRCAAQTSVETAVVNGFRCPECGADLPDRPDYTVEGATSAVEVVRAFGAYGYTEEFAPPAARPPGPQSEPADEQATCPGCGHAAALGADEGDAFVVDATRRVDPSAGPSDQAEVLAVRCPSCGAAGTLVRAAPDAAPDVRARA